MRCHLQKIFLPFLAMCITGITSAQWTDHFEDICSLQQWSDIQVTEGWNIQALELHDISLTNPATLH
ncbi:MAG: hypothetical protein IPL92_16635 [Saprospiraceae bacterium]|nr:hypothetical protein [Candidatus Opimibacter iunctus]